MHGSRDTTDLLGAQCLLAFRKRLRLLRRWPDRIDDTLLGCLYG
jgi:hypothetical protein